MRSVALLVNWLKGIGMGAADVVPGFSGGTVALITGIYERLVLCISHFDGAFLDHLLKRRWREAFSHIDGLFLVSLVVGMACGFVMSTLTIKGLLDWPPTRPYVLAAFIGMVFGSSWFVWETIRRLGPIRPTSVACVIAGAAAAATLSWLPGTTSESPALWFVFVCGAIAICAMILPGISGALMLMVLGIYEFLMGTAKSLIHLENLRRDLLVCLVFGAGCSVGLLAFSRLLRWLFVVRPAETLSVMFGLMLGAVVKLWPFAANADHPAAELISPAPNSPSWLGVFVTVSVFLLATLAFTRLGLRQPPDSKNATQTDS